MGFTGFRLGGVAVLIDVDDAVSAPVHRSLRWRQPLRLQVASPSSAPSGQGTPVPRAKEPALRDRVASIEWYHTMDLGDGIVTPGSFDHRPHLDNLQLPDRFDGMRVLDVATFDGFWAFEFERRGASEVVAIDLDRYGDVDLAPRARARLSTEQLNKPLASGFALAHDVLRSSVRREALSVYDLSPERLGTFDFVFCSNLLLHLKNPITALENIRRVAMGRAVIVDTFNPLLPQKTIKYIGGAEKSVWWFFSLGALEQMIRDAGFDEVTLTRKFRITYGNGQPLWQAAFSARP